MGENLKKRRTIMRLVCTCTAVLCVTIVASAQSTDKNKDVKKPDAVTYSRIAAGDVLIECVGEKRYSLRHFRAMGLPKEKGEEKDWVASVEIVNRKSPHDQCAYLLSKLQSVTINNVVLVVEKYEGKVLFEYYGSRYELVKGKMPDSKEVRPHGTLKWKKSDGSHEYFHEKGSCRIWKRYFWRDDKKK